MTEMRAFIANLLNREASGVADNAGIVETPGWDSFAQLNIMLELEQRFGVPITDETIREYSNLAAILRLEESKGLKA